jgi:hypothetical protein
MSKDKAISAKDRGGPKAFDKSRLPHFPDNQLTVDVDVVSFMSR